MSTTARLAPLTALLTIIMGATGCRSRPVVDPAATHPIPAWEVSAPVEGHTYQRVVVFGDWGTGTSDQKAVAKAMVTRIAALPGKQVDFLLSTGDNFYPQGVESVDDPGWEEKFEQVYDHPSLKVPVWITVGNHDYKGNLQAQIDYTRKNPRWLLPKLYYSFSKPVGPPPKKGQVGKTVEFFCLDTTPLGRDEHDPEPQLAWFENALKASTATWKVAVGHHPMYTHTRNRSYADWLIEKLEPLFDKYGVDVYLAGHDHALELTQPIKGVYHVLSGAAAGPRKAYQNYWTEKSIYAATLGGFVLMRVGADELVLEFVRMNGKTQYAHTLRKKAN